MSKTTKDFAVELIERLFIHKFKIITDILNGHFKKLFVESWGVQRLNFKEIYLLAKSFNQPLPIDSVSRVRRFNDRVCPN